MQRVQSGKHNGRADCTTAAGHTHKSITAQVSLNISMMTPCRRAYQRWTESPAYLLRPHHHQVVAGLWTGVVAAGQRQQAGLPAGGARSWVAAVSLSGRVVAGRRTPGDTQLIQKQTKHG